MLNEYAEFLQQRAAQISLQIYADFPQRTERATKTLTSIREKMLRSSTALSQMQDIVGCRIIVSDVGAQDVASGLLRNRFPDSRIVDSRLSGKAYRAIHFIVHEPPFNYEIQLRTELQDAWAQVSEAYAVRYGQDVKYGGGPGLVRAALDGLSQWIADFEGGSYVPDPEHGMWHQTKEDFLEELQNLSTMGKLGDLG